jgi:WD40 repeat protein
VARYEKVELISVDSRSEVRTLKSEHRDLNALAFSDDGKRLFAAGGQAGLMGEVQEWDVSSGKLIRTYAGHRDALYSLAISPDGRTLATGSYDQKIKLWNVDSGSEIRTLSGHNGAIFDLAFRPDGRILASASADRTVKLWDVATGERRDTLSQSLKEVASLVFSRDGQRLFAAGADNRIRLWEISEKAQETTNPILESRFAHEGAILKLALSSDGHTLISSASDQSVKLWNTAGLTERLLLEKQPDWGSAVVFADGDKAVVVGRLDGTLQFYDATSGKVLAPPKPQLVRAEPRGMQRGTTLELKLIGSNLVGLTEIKFSDARLKGQLKQPSSGPSDEARLVVTSADDLPRGSYEISVSSTNGTSGTVKFAVDDLQQLYLRHGDQRTAHQKLDSLPLSVWAAHEHSGDDEDYLLHAESGTTLVFDVVANGLGSKAEPVLTLFDDEGTPVASTSGPQGGNDALLAYTFVRTGEYRLHVNELVLGASADHFYRISIGHFPFVTGFFPLSIPEEKDSEVSLIGYNLPKGASVKVAAQKPGEVKLPLTEEFRSQREFKVIVSDIAESLESEPNDRLADATSLTPPCAVGGKIWKGGSAPDVDCFRFDAKAGQPWMIETAAATRGSPVDTRIEILDADGKPVERLLLQAVRDSAITFRGIDSDSTDCRVLNWEEMELNQYLYLQGEVVKLFRAPQGPDSGFVFYSSNGKRHCFFDTSASAHPVDQPCYIVEPHPAGAKLVATGLPVFPVYFDNDDDGDRGSGSDSKLQFTAPVDGTYFIRVTDARGFAGEQFAYRLVVRPVEQDFQVELKGKDLSVGAGSGQAFSVEAKRMDEFSGPITVSIDNVPAGFIVSTPLVIQAGHSEANGLLYASLDAPTPKPEDWAKVEITATASVNGRAYVKAVNNFGKVKLVEKPKLFVSLEPDPSTITGTAASTGKISPGAAGEPLREITIAPGQTVPALLRVQRNGYDDLITFTVEDLPHGVIVDNIGLNGVLIPKDQNERQIFLTAAKWVPETDRLCYAVEAQAGRQTSRPVMLHVRRPAPMQAAAAATR